MATDDAAWDEAAALHGRAAALLARDRVAEASPLARAAWEGLLATAGPLHPDAGNAALTLAEIHARQGRLGPALDLLDAAVRSCRPWVGEAAADAIRWQAMLDRADLLVRLARYPEADAALDELEGEAPAREALGVALLNLRGMLRRFEGRWEEALALYRRALPGTRGAVRAGLLHNLAGLAAARGDFVEAERRARQALAARRGRRDRAYACDLAGLGDALAGQGRHARAADCYREAVGLLAGENAADPELACARHNLGDALAALGLAVEAEAAYRASLAQKYEIYGDAHPEVAGTLANLAALYADLGRWDEARARSAEAREAARDLPPDHPIRQGVEALARALHGGAAEAPRG